MTSIVLLPGLDGTGLLFRPLLEAAPADFEPIVVSYPSSRHSGFDALLVSVREQLPAGPWLLVAESFSGPLAIQLAASRPPGLAGLVLVATAARWPYLRRLTWLPFGSLFRLPIPDLALRSLVLGHDVPRELLALTREAISRVEPSVLGSRLRELARTDARSDLARVEVPVLYLEAQQDRLVQARDRASVIDSPIGVEHRVVPGPHFLLQARPRQCWPLILDFGSRTPSAAPRLPA